MTAISQEAARRAFPRGLAQPEAGFRFGADALLLACFAASQAGRRVLDLGTGCGAAGLGLLLSRADQETQVVGLDKDPAMVAAATENARRLGLIERFTAREGNVRAIRDMTDVPPESFDMVVTNPPYRHPASGRRPEDPGRDAARFETDGGLEAFFKAAAYALCNQGRLVCIYLAERLSYMVSLLTANKLEIKHIIPISARLGEPARQLLVLARKNGRPGLHLDAPLALYTGRGSTTHLSAQARRFCPFLACNPGPGNPGETD